ncbi:MAG: PleD family two-component system response regulator [Candidatus Sumerlaeia bacterium]
MASDSKWRILCIDDEPDVLEILKVSLGINHEVITASNGIEAVAMLDFCDADFIICDVHMPGMDGFQTVEAIRNHPQYMTVPVFFLTAETGRDEAKKGFESGANLYLTKPFEPTRVLQNIDYFLQESGQEPKQKRLSADEVQKRAKQLMREKAPLDATARQSGVTRIIVIDHHSNQVRRIRHALDENYEVIPCADPLASLQQLFRYEPDLLIINPGVPRLSGWGLVQIIRQNARFRKLPILLIRDDENPMDERLIPTITKFDLIEPNASEDDIAEAVKKVVEKPEFVIHPKQAAFKQLVAEENKLRQQMEEERDKRLQQEQNVRARYQKIQSFIDENRSY